jgi:anti-sigma-K factor RskA
MARLIVALFAITATAVMAIALVWTLRGEAPANAMLAAALDQVGSFLHWAAGWLVNWAKGLG